LVCLCVGKLCVPCVGGPLCLLCVYQTHNFLCLVDVCFVFTLCLLCVHSHAVAYEDFKIGTCVLLCLLLCLPNVPLVFTALTQTRVVFTIWPSHNCTALLCLCLLVFTTLVAERCVDVFAAYLGADTEAECRRLIAGSYCSEKVDAWS